MSEDAMRLTVALLLSKGLILTAEQRSERQFIVHVEDGQRVTTGEGRTFGLALDRAAWSWIRLAFSMN